MASAYKNLPITKSSQIIQDKGTEAYYLFVILFIFSIVNLVLNSFPLSVMITLFVLLIFKWYLNGKPKKFLIHLFEFFTLPKQLTHQFKDKGPVFPDEGFSAAQEWQAQPK